MAPSWLCSSISAIPAVPPKLPSIWNTKPLPIGCVSNRFLPVLAFSSWATHSCACSPSSRRAQKSMVQARLQPVCPPPAASRRSSEMRAAFARSGRAARRDLPARIQAVQMRHVAVPGLGFREVLRPLEQLAVLAGAIGPQPSVRVPKPLPELGIDAEDRRRLRCSSRTARGSGRCPWWRRR